MDLFEAASASNLEGVPLPERLRPKRLRDVVGQRHLVGEGSFLRRSLSIGRLPSVLLWGPPGTGKTTLAEVLSHEFDARFVRMSAVLVGVKDVRLAVEEAKRARHEHRRKTLLFLDEIHRFNKSQQDALLPHVENGTITLIGATTENPSFEVNAALLSRCRVLTVKPLDDEDQQILLERALTTKERGLGHLHILLEKDAAEALKEASAGDARRLLLSLEVAADLALSDRDKAVPDDVNTAVTLEHVEQAVARRLVRFDKEGDAHYGVISAYIKSMRGSDPDAALYYLARMLEAGEDPRFILRRLVIFASEDVGCADPRSLEIATAALQAFNLLGLPEGEWALAQATVHLAAAPKSNAAYMGLKRAREAVQAHPDAALPPSLQNAPTALMKREGLGVGYRYPHDHGGFTGDEYLPEQVAHEKFYRPTKNGSEAAFGRHLHRLWGDERYPEFRPPTDED
ncbi:MAG: replication-associated recombination protein A [Deltaproteobacteria bacterium]|nr:replication-associated recombination protein A [Deltaproteobacteria bacterium]